MCGIFGIANHSEASGPDASGLYALRTGTGEHRISSSDRAGLHDKSWACRDLTTKEHSSASKHQCIGHTRYSTAGENTKGTLNPSS